MATFNKKRKRRQISFRIGPLCADRLEHVAALFNMKPSQYVKALLYKDLGVFNEPLDMRRSTWRQKKRQQEEAEEDEALIIATAEDAADQQDFPEDSEEDVEPGRGFRVQEY